MDTKFKIRILELLDILKGKFYIFKPGIRPFYVKFIASKQIKMRNSVFLNNAVGVLATFDKAMKDADIEYTAWYWDQIYGDHKEYVGEILKANGYEIRSWKSTYNNTENFYLVSPEELEAEKKNNEALNEIENKLNNGETIEFTTEYNPDEEGNCRIGDVIYHFNEVKENYYQGWTYYLPVVNGKQKRIKNKKLTITKYTYSRNENVITINIGEFIINK